MYGTEAGTKVYNGTSVGSTATINLGANNTTGIYLDNGAYGYNYGTIRSVGSGLKKVVGVVVKKWLYNRKPWKNRNYSRRCSWNFI